MLDEHLVGMIQLNLKKEWADERIFQNPRCEEIYNAIISLAEKMGIVDKYSPFYRTKMQPRIQMLLGDSHTLQVDKKGNIVIKFPDYYEQFDVKPSRQEMRTYESLPDGTMKRTVEIKENEEQEIIISKINQDGIETEKTVQKIRDGKIKKVTITRLEGYPHIVKVLQDNKVKYYDISQTEHLEDIQMEGAMPIVEDEIRKLDPTDEIRILEKTKWIPYKKGIRDMYGVKENIEINKGRGE